MSWENILKVSSMVWKRFVVKLFEENPSRSMTVRQVIDNLIDNSTIGGSEDKDKMKYSI